MESSTTALDSRYYFRVLRRNWLIILLIAFAAAAGALLLTYLRPVQYRATAEVIVEPFQVADPGLNLATELWLAQSRAVESRVTKEGEPPGDLEVTVESGTDILRFSYVADNESDAQTFANEFASSYLDFRRERAVERISRAQLLFRERISSAREELAELLRDIRQADNEFESATLLAHRDGLLLRLQALEDDLSALDPELAEQEGGELISSAETPEEPIGAEPLKNTAVAAIVGLVFAIGVVLLRDRDDSSSEESPQSNA